MTAPSSTAPAPRGIRRGRCGAVVPELLVAGLVQHRRFAELPYGSLGSALVRQAPCPAVDSARLAYHRGDASAVRRACHWHPCRIVSAVSRAMIQHSDCPVFLVG